MKMMSEGEGDRIQHRQKRHPRAERTRTQTKKRNRISKKKKKKASSCFEQLLDNLIVWDLGDICAAIVQPSQDIDLHQARPVSREATKQS